MIQHQLLYALMGTGITFAGTILGAALVFLFKKGVGANLQKGFLGFAAGVMIAASVWSLLIPSIEMASSQGQLPILPAAFGFAAGGIFFILVDHLLPHLHPGSRTPEGIPSKLKRTTMLVLAVTLHNIPEGMAVGLTFALAAQSTGSTALSGAMALAVGMALQNFPEGAAISLPLKNEGLSRGKAFFYGAMSGIVEPIAAVITVLIAGSAAAAMPWLLAFAAGAMIFVVAEDLIPECSDGTTHLGTMGVMSGFLIMMILDVTLG